MASASGVPAAAPVPRRPTPASLGADGGIAVWGRMPDGVFHQVNYLLHHQRLPDGTAMFYVRGGFRSGKDADKPEHNRDAEKLDAVISVFVRGERASSGGVVQQLSGTVTHASSPWLPPTPTLRRIRARRGPRCRCAVARPSSALGVGRRPGAAAPPHPLGARRAAALVALPGRAPPVLLAEPPLTLRPFSPNHHDPPLSAVSQRDDRHQQMVEANRAAADSSGGGSPGLRVRYVAAGAAAHSHRDEDCAGDCRWQAHAFH